MRAHHVACFGTTFFVFAAILWATGPRIALKVTPSVGWAPQSVRVQVTVEPAEDQRQLYVSADSESVTRGSSVPLDGLHGPRTTWIDWRDLPAGNYDITAAVATSHGLSPVTHAHLLIVDGRMASGRIR